MSRDEVNFHSAAQHYSKKASKPLRISSLANEMIENVATEGVLLLCKYLESIHKKDEVINANDVESAIKKMGLGTVMKHGPELGRNDPEDMIKKLESSQINRMTQKKKKAL